MAKKLWFLVLILAAFALVIGCATTTALAYPNPFNSEAEENWFIDTAQDISPPIQDKTFVNNLSVASTFDTLVAMSVPVAGLFSNYTNRNQGNAGHFENVAVLPGELSGSQNNDVLSTQNPPTLTAYGHQEVAVPIDLAGCDSSLSIYNVIGKSGASPLIAIAGTTFDHVNTDSILANTGPPSSQMMDVWADRGSPTQEVWQPNIGEKSAADNSSEDAEKVPKLGYSENTAVVCENNLV